MADNIQTAENIQIAASDGLLDSVRAFLAAGVSPNEPDGEKRTHAPRWTDGHPTPPSEGVKCGGRAEPQHSRGGKLEVRPRAAAETMGAGRRRKPQRV